MKIQLPNPDNMTVEQWFAHMRIVLKAAEKTYQQMVQDLGEDRSEEDGNNPWIKFEVARDNESLFKDIELDGLNEDLPHGLYLELNSLT